MFVISNKTYFFFYNINWKIFSNLFIKYLEVFLFYAEVDDKFQNYFKMFFQLLFLLQSIKYHIFLFVLQSVLYCLFSCGFIMIFVISFISSSNFLFCITTVIFTFNALLFANANKFTYLFLMALKAFV